MLDKKLEEYSKSKVYPFHMPGHKRVSMANFDPYKVDITEIPGFDDLHDAKSVIDELQRGYAKLYGAKEAFLSVNGSTLGNLAGIFSATSRGDEIIVMDGCHRSVIHGAELNDLKVHTIVPEPAESMDNRDRYSSISGPISLQQVKEALDRFPDSKLLVITSPTYEGLVSDIDGIVDAAHKKGVTVHIDGAHGAHHGLGGIWERSIISSQADTVVLSLHKTLPAFTGSSVLLRSEKSRTSREKILYYMDCFETSSPSYIMMYGMAVCLRFLQESGRGLFDEYAKRLESFYEAAGSLSHLKVCRFVSQDISKIIIGTGGYLSGAKLADKLRQDFLIETELTGEDYCLALSSVMDSEEGFTRLRDALFEIDKTEEEM